VSALLAATEKAARRDRIPFRIAGFGQSCCEGVHSSRRLCQAEDIENKPAFREAFRQRRCLVQVANFYEWKKVDGGKQPYAIGLKGGGLMALAGLSETWASGRFGRMGND
jgi:putative SOS response-associated peptidase YedK